MTDQPDITFTRTLGVREDTEYFIIHCAATTKSMDIGANEIHKWHLARGWAGIGYHYVVRRNGIIEEGRPVDTVGAHCKGENSHSIGICMVGGSKKENGKMVTDNNFTEDQFHSLSFLIDHLDTLYENCEVRGHSFFNPNKDCPSFNVTNWVDDKIATDNGRVECLEIVYNKMKAYPDTSEVYTVLRKVLDEIGELK